MESAGGADEIEVPPRGMLKMQRCFPVSLSIVDTDASLDLNRSAEVQIIDQNDAPRLQRQ
jgi:hypothetical protein